jgi:hypothetical protein
VKRLLIGSAIVAVGLGTLSTASAAPSQWKVTGGGQIIASTQNGGGPGATLAFTARGNGGPARGQLQYNDHLGVKFHGTVTCLVVMTEDTDQNDETAPVKVARLGGTYTATTAGQTGFFQLYVEDHDNGGPQNGVEVLIFDDSSTDSSCADEGEEDEEAKLELGRGNITIHKEKAPKA